MTSRFAICAVAVLTLSLTVAAYGQPRTYGNPTGFGSILFPGTGAPPPLTPGGTYHAPIWRAAPTFGDRLSGNIQGNVLPGNGGRGRGNTVIVPYAVPMYYGGGYGDYYPQQQQPPNVTIVQQPAMQPVGPSTPVVINQYYSQAPSASAENGSSSLRLYEAPGAPAYEPPPAPKPAAAPSTADAKPIIYLIAFKSGAIYPTLAYWVEGDTLQYISMDKTLNKASLDLIDRDMSTRLNQERNVDFSLPNSR